MNGKMTTMPLCPAVVADMTSKVTPAKIIRNAITSSLDPIDGRVRSVSGGISLAPFLVQLTHSQPSD